MKSSIWKLFALVLGLTFWGCKDGIRSGDLIFVSVPESAGADSAAGAIAAATSPEENFVHVAIAEVNGDSVFVVDATMKRGVHRHPLDTLIKDFTRHNGTLPVLRIKRLKKGYDPAFLENAKSFLGQAYNYSFRPNDSTHYCTELVRDSYITKDGTHLFDEVPMNFKNADGEFPPYWVRLFGRLGTPIPQDRPGTNPKQIWESPRLVPVRVGVIPFLEDVSVFD